MSPGTVLHVVDDDASFRTALLRLLRAAGYSACGYSSAAELLAAHPGAHPGCVVSDIRMPQTSGLELQQALARTSEPLPIVFLTGHGDVPCSVQAMKGGAVDFLTKPVTREALLAAVESALRRDAEERALRRRSRQLDARFATLSAREREVLALVVGGKPNKQVAAELGVAERTVKAHRARVMAKMGADSLPDLVRDVECLKLWSSARPPRGR